MSKLKELIQKLCPDGVEYKKLGEVGTFTRGNGLQKKDFTENGVGCIHYGQIYTYYGFYATKTKSFVNEALARNLTQVKPGDVIIACTSENIEDICKAVAWLGNENIVTGGHACVFSHNENPKFVSYFFQTEMFFQQKRKFARGAKVIDIKVADLSKIEIPVPPLPVQEEIVRILDLFTDLAAELQARREQYEYYRDKLLTFDKVSGGGILNVTWMTMSEIGDFYGGLSGKSKSDFVNGNSKYATYMNVYKNLALNIYATDMVKIAAGEKQNTIQYGDVLFTGSSETPDECGMSSVVTEEVYEPIYLNSFCFGFRPYDKSLFSPDFLKHLLRSKAMRTEITKTANGVTRFNVSKKSMGKILLPIPPYKEQKRLATILDKFETLVNDLAEGLPTEMAAVQEQYEYYRNKLLSFPRFAAGA